MVIHQHQEARDDKVFVRLARLLVSHLLGVGGAAPGLYPEACVVRRRVLERREGEFFLLQGKSQCFMYTYTYINRVTRWVPA